MTTLYVQVFNQKFYDSPRSVQANQLNFVATEYHFQPSQQYIFDYGTTNASATPYPIFATDDLAIAHFTASASSILLDDVNGEFGFTFYTDCDIEKIPAPVGADINSLTFDDFGDGSTNKAYTATEKTKLSTLATVSTTGSYTDLADKPSIPAAQIQVDWNQATGGALDYVKNKPSLSTVATSGSYNDLTSKPTIPVVQVYNGVTQRLNAFAYFGSATVSSGVTVFYLTTDGTSGGTALFPNGPITDSVNITPNDATALYGFSWAWTNSNKTLTVTVNKSSATGVISLLGLNLLGSPIAAANGTVVKLQVWGY